MTSGERDAPGRFRRRALLGLAVVASLLAFVGWGDRSATTSHELVGAEILVVNVAGPVTVRGDGAADRATVSESWLFGRPEVIVEQVDGRDVVRSRCPGWGPCRAAIELWVAPSANVVVVAAEAVTVTGFDGSLSVLSADGDIDLGPVSGSLRAVAGGRVSGSGLLAQEVEISAGGPVEVTFDEVPGSLVVDSATDVDAVLPEATYFVAADAGGTLSSDLSEADDAPSRLVLDAGGDVSLSTGGGDD